MADPATDVVERVARAADALLNAADRRAYEIAEPIFADEREELRLALAEYPETAALDASDLVGENERLREALKPFAEFCDVHDYVPDEHKITLGSSMAKRQLTMADCRKARAALKQEEANGNEA